MKTKVQSSLFALLALPVMSFGVLALVPQNAAAGPAPDPETNGTCQPGQVNVAEGVDCARGEGARQNLFGGTGSLFAIVTNVLLFLIGAVSVIMLIVGGFRYVLSNGDSTQVTNAKNTILYAVIGIIVALLAYAIVNFVVSSFIAQPAAASKTLTE
jgi:hypothetical protein